MTEKTDLAERGDVSNESWGTRTDVVSTGGRLKEMLPGVKNQAEAMRLAQASILSRANPFRGELYIFGDNIVEGYKLLVRWAKRQEDYTTEYIKLADDDPQMLQVRNAKIGYICELWRESVRAGLVEACKAGIPYDVASRMYRPERAVGIVNAKDMGNDPPKGWTWDQVAKKRALKNALNLAYGMPSPDELSRETWEVDGQETKAEDWNETDNLNPGSAEALAKSNAQWREHEAAMQNDTAYREEHKAQNKAAASALFGGPVVDAELVEPSTAAEADEELGDWMEAQKNAPDPEPEATPKPARKTEKVTRPAPANTVRHWLRVKAWGQGFERPAFDDMATQMATQKQTQQVAALFGKAITWADADEADLRKARYLTYQYIYGEAVTSGHDMTAPEAQAIIDWMGGGFEPQDPALSEARFMYHAAQIENGQQELDF